MKKRVISFLLVACMILGMMPASVFAAGTGTSSDPIVVYRNPVDDYAGDSLSASGITEALAVMTKFHVRTSTSNTWKDQIIAAAEAAGHDVTGAEDVYYHVSTANLGDVSITKATWYRDIVPVYCGYWFGWRAAKGGVAGTDTETTVNIVDGNGDALLSNDLVVKVKGFVDVTWSVGNGTTYESAVSLDKALSSADNYKTATEAATAYAATLTATDKQYSYEFVGWDSSLDSDSDADTNLDSVVDVTAADGCVAANDVDGATYNAVYKTTVKTYTVTWKNDNGDVLETDTDVEYGATPTYDGATPVAQNTVEGKTYTFIGWTPEVNEVNGHATYTATYTAVTNKYTVNWVNNGGDVLETDTDVEYGTIPTYDGATPVAQNAVEGKTYTFTGWTPDVDIVTGDVTYTATYTTATTVYTVTFNENGGSTVSDATVGHGEVITADTITTRTGYRFVCWTLDGKEFDFSTTIVSDITLEAQWVKQVTVTYETDSDSVIAPVTVDENSVVSRPADPTKTAAVFNGWYTDAVCENAYDFSAPVTADITLYAGWLDQYTVSFIGNGGSGSMAEQTFIESKAQALADNVYTRSGYTFLGWATAADGAVVYADGAEITVSADLALFAVWKENPEIETTIVVSDAEVTVTYDSFTQAELLSLIGPKVMAEGFELSDATVTVTDITENEVGTYTVTISYAGGKTAENEYAASSAEATVIIEKATASVVVSSQTVKYGQKVVDMISANCATIDILVGLDAHDETDLLGLVQVALPEDLMLLLAFATNASGIDLNDLSLSDLETLVKMAQGKVEALDLLVARLAEYEETLVKLVDTLKKVQAKLPMDSELRISVVNTLTVPENMGVYLIASISADENYTTDLDAGYLIITPNGIKAELTWNEIDDNYVITLDKKGKFDLGATADVIESTADGVSVSDAEAQSHVEYIFIGVDDNGDLLLDRCTNPNAVELGLGVYAQVAYIANWDNVMYYAEPLVRPIVVSPNVADVAILDGNGNENYAQVYEYGEEIKLTVSVNGVAAPVEGLTVKYIGSDTTVNGWYRTEVPTDAGVYTVVAVYTKEDVEGNLVTAGGAVGVLIIEPADTEVNLEDAEYCYDGNQYFAALTNTELDYVTVAIDRENNIAYVNLPEDTADHIENLIAKLPYEVETYVNSVLEKYADFDGTVETATIKAELIRIIEKLVAVDMTAEATAKAEQLVDALVEELKANEKVQAMIERFKAELNSIKDQISSEIPDDIEEKLTAYIKAVVTVTEGGVDVDAEKIKTDIKDLIDELKTQLPDVVVAELYEMADEIINAIESHVNVEAIENKASEIVAAVKELDAEEVTELIYKAIGAAYGYVDLTEVKALVNEIIAKVEAQGYIDYVKNMVANIAGMYKGDIDTSEVEAAVDTLVSKIKEAISNGNIHAGSLESLEKYLDEVLVSLISIVDQIPEGTIIFGQNPSEVGEYDCYAINISANYKAEFIEADLVIYAEHQYDEGVITTEPTCTMPGVKTYTCTMCDHSYTEEIPAKGHVAGEEVVENYVEATATTDGSFDLVVYCSVCHEELSRKTVIIPATGEVTPDPEGPTPEAPDSGDNNSLWLWVAVMVVSVMCAFIAIVEKERRNL